MRSNYLKALAFATTAALVSGTVSSVSAQIGGPNQLRNETLTQMRSQNWKGALEIIDRAIKNYEPRRASLGLKDDFGWFYYQRGMCLFQLKQYAEAKEAFHKCYTDYPKQENPLVRLALFQEGVNSFYLGEYGETVKILEKFMKERRPNGVEAQLNLGEVYSLLAQCYFKQEKPDFTKGLASFTQCVENRNTGKGISEQMIAQGCLAMIKAAMTTNNVNQAVTFLTKYGSVLNLSPARLAAYAPSIYELLRESLALSQESLAKGEGEKADQFARLSFILAGLLPNMKDVIADAKLGVTKLGASKGVIDGNVTYSADVLKKTMENFQKLEEEKTIFDALAITFFAQQALALDNQKLAEASFQVLEDYYPQMANREGSLYTYALLTRESGQSEKADALINRHLETFPNSKHAATLNTVSLEKLLKEHRYEDCIKAADKIMKEKADDPKHTYFITAKFCKAASLFYLKKMKDSVKELEEFVKTYPESNYVQQAMYLTGDALTSLQRPEEANKVFTSYITRFGSFENNEFMAPVLFTRAYNYYNIGSEENDKLALADVETLLQHYPDIKLAGPANILLGRLYSGAKQPEKAMESFKKGYEIALKFEDKQAAGDAAYQLAVDTSKLPLPGNLSPEDRDKALAERNAEVKKWYDDFWKNCDFDGSRNALMMGAFGVSEFQKDPKEFDAAITRLGEVIVREGKKENSPLITLLEQAVGSYTKNYVDGNKALGREVKTDEMRNHFYNFPGVDNKKDIALSTMLRMAMIGIYQEMNEAITGTTDADRQEKARLQGVVDGLFSEISRDFKPQDLTPFTLLKLARYLSNTEQPERSVPYFDQIIALQKNYVNEATFGKAIALGRSKDKAKIDEAIRMMSSQLASGGGDKKAKEEAQYYMILFNHAKGDWAATVREGEKYQSEKFNNQRRQPEVLLLIGDAYMNDNKLDKALASYLNVNVGFKNRVLWSAPATMKMMDVLVKRNTPSEGLGKRPSDKYTAWKSGADYVVLLGTEANRQKMTPDQLLLLNELETKVKQLGEDSDVSRERSEIANYEQMKKDAKSGK